MDWTPFQLIIAGILVGLFSGGIFLLIWQRIHSDKTPQRVHIQDTDEDHSLQQRLDHLTGLHAVAAAGAEATDENLFIEKVMIIIGDQITCDNFGLLMVDEKAERLRTHPSYQEAGKLKGPEWIPIGEGVCGQVALIGEPIYVANVQREQNYIEVDSEVRSELCIPLKIGERVIGVLNAEKKQVDGFSESDQRFLGDIARQSATIIRRLRTESSVQRRSSQLSILSDISQEIVASLVPEQVYATIHRAAAQLLPVQIFLIALRDEDRQELFPAYLMDQDGPVSADAFPAYKKLGAQITTTGNPILLNQQQGLDLPGANELNGLVSKHSILAVPLKLGGRVFGMLTCQGSHQNEYGSDDLDTLKTLANQAAIAIENARLFEETQHRLAELTFLSQIIAITATENDLTVALNLICSELAKFLLVPEVSFALFNSQLTMAQIIAEYHHADRPDILGKQIPVISNPVLTSLLETSSPLAIDDVQTDPLLVSMPDSGMDRGVASLLIVPIIFGGEVVGILQVISQVPRKFLEGEILLVQKVTNQVGQVLERLGLFAATRDQAERMSHLTTISEGLNRPLTPSEVIESIGKGAMLLGQADRAALYLPKENGQVTAAWSENLSADHLQQITQSFPQVSEEQVFSSSTPTLIPDIQQLPANSILRSNGIQEGFLGMDAWPLIYKDNVVATILCYYDEPHMGSDTEQEVMLTFARQAAVALVNARLFDETRRRTAQLEALNAIITEVTAASDLEHLLEITLEHTLRALSLDVGSIWVAEYCFQQGMASNMVDLFKQITQEAMDRGKPATQIHDWHKLTEDDHLFSHSSELKGYNLRASLAVPLISEGRMIGGVCLVSEKPHDWLDEEIAIVEGVSRQLAGAVERIALLERIQENARQVQHIIDTVPEGVILLDEQMRVVLANPVAQTYLIKLAVFETGDILTHLGQSPLEDFLKPEQQNIWHELEVSGPPRRVFEIGTQPLEQGDSSGGWVVVIREVTQERETQTRIQMQERLATVGQLAAGIAHDFNNILAAIVVYADLLRRDPNLLSASQERLTIIQQQVQRAASLIRQILDFSRRSVMEQSTLDLLPFVKELDKLLRRVLPETIHIALTYQPGIYLVNADPTRLQQVFMNLAVNARDAFSDGGTLHFELDQVQIAAGEPAPCPDVPEGVWNRITVTDTGEGIPAEVLPHIFEPFFTTKAVGEGTGLGLAQAYGIIKQHNGHIDAHSALGQGTTFHIYLPAQQPISEDMDLPDFRLEIKGSGETLLLAEDDYSTREALKTLLVDSNYHVLTATNGREALDIYEQKAGKIAMVISDIVMPVMGGVVLYQHLLERWPEVKILFITGHPVSEKDQTLLESGNIHWLQKPFSVGVLNEVIHNILHQ
ncbi:MAG: GAF domain-containing protein [Chloroflexota bacterium]|nr:MAG: GAF domain-containing protein [Chloroflexota bacterium]